MSKLKDVFLNLLKMFLLFLTIAIIIGIIFYLFPVIKNISSKEGQLIFKEKIDAFGILGIIVLFGLQVAQIVLVFVPAEPLEILAGMCYGVIGGTIFIMVSAFVISTSIYFLVRKFGKKIIYQIFDKQKVSKIERSKLFNNPKKIELLMFVLFFIPGTPKDLLVYVAGLLPLKPSRFIIISTFARFPSIISSTLAGKNIAMGNWKNSIILYVAILLIVAIVIFIINIFDKNNITKEAIDVIK